MDRTSIIGIILCIVLYFGLSLALEKYYPTPPPKPRPAVVSASDSTPATAPAPVPATISAVPGQPTVPVIEKISLLENDAIRVTLTSQGAAIKEVELNQHKDDTTGNIVLNEESHSNILALSGWPGADTAQFQVTENPPDSVVYSAVLSDGVKWERTYTLAQSKDKGSGLGAYLKSLFQKISRHLGQKTDADSLVYNLEVKESLTNTGAADVTLPAYALSVGRAEPLRIGGHYQQISNLYLGSGWLAREFHLVTINDFNPGSIPIIGIKTRDGKDLFSSKTVEDAPVRWLGVENQFFTVLLTPGADRPIDHAQFQCFNPRDLDGRVPPDVAPDIEATAFFPELSVPAGQTVTLNYGIYAGPKEYDRLNALGDQQGELMNYGWCEPVILSMLAVIHFWHSLVGNYGVAIILLTVLIKIITWPLVSISNRSGKRMQALAPKLKELQAKYKDQPEKISSETWSLYRDYGVNPLGGCLPALVQMPVFISLYYMLQNLTELRGQSFLWIHDLTQPDTVATLTFAGSHFALHPLPIMVTGLTMVMMRMTPQIGDPQQAKIAQFMPLVFLFIFYNFAAALSLYYVVNNCVSIVQIYRNLKKPMPELKRVPRKKTA